MSLIYIFLIYKSYNINYSYHNLSVEMINKFQSFKNKFSNIPTYLNQ